MKKTPVGVKNKKRIAIGFIVLAVLMILLAFRVAWIQVVDADELTRKAIDQQTSDVPIEAKEATYMTGTVTNLPQASYAILCG